MDLKSKLSDGYSQRHTIEHGYNQRARMSKIAMPNSVLIELKYKLEFDKKLNLDVDSDIYDSVRGKL